MLRLLQQEMRSRRGAIIGWGLGLSFFPVVYLGIYPAFAEQMSSFQSLMELPIYQAMGITMASFEGFVASTVTNIVPILLSIYAVIMGVNTLAGEEENGRLELIVALPIPRWQIATVKAIAIGITLFLILVIVSAASALTFMAIESQVETAVTPLALFFSLLAAWPIVMAVGMISLFLGAFCPTRRIAAMIAAVIVVIGYFGSNLAGMLASLEKVQKLFLFYYYDATADALVNGQQTSHMLLLLVVALLAYGLTVYFFQKRNLTVAEWPWRKAKIA